MVKTALICDANITARINLKGMLKGIGFDEVWECGNGKHAMELALGNYPDMVVIDTSMPEMDGISIAGQIRKSLKIPVILLSNGYHSKTTHEAIKCGIAAFLIKPLREQDLLPAIVIAMAHNKEVEDLKETIEDLKESIENRKIIEKAKGTLMEKEHLSESEAYRTLQKMAMNGRRSMSQIAVRVLKGEICIP